MSHDVEHADAIKSWARVLPAFSHTSGYHWAQYVAVDVWAGLAKQHRLGCLLPPELVERAVALATSAKPGSVSELKRETIVAAVRRAMTALVAILRSLAGQPCPDSRCEGHLTIGPGTGPHFARAECSRCGRFARWVRRPDAWKAFRREGGPIE
jgi:hypothetical protein